MAAVLRSPYCWHLCAGTKDSRQEPVRTAGTRTHVSLPRCFNSIPQNYSYTSVYVIYIDILQYSSVSIKTRLLAQQQRNRVSIADNKTVHMALLPIQRSTREAALLTSLTSISQVKSAWRYLSFALK